MTDRELLQDALDALNNFDKGNHGMRWQVPLIKALRARLAQPEPEPEKSQDKPCVEDDGCPTEKAVLQRFWREHQAQPEQEPVGINKVIIDSIRDSSEIVAPPQREWVGLTDEEINILFKNSLKSIPTGVIWNISRTIEAKLKEKNT